MTEIRKASPWATFAICAAGAYITTLDLSIVNVAFPEIMKAFPGVSRAHVAWVVTIYNIFFGSLLVIGGKTADRFGRKRIFQLGAATFGVGSLLAAVAPTLPLLVAGRAVQGLGGAFLTPATLGLLLGAFPPERRTQVVSMWGGIGALGVASGPSLGAALIELTNWRMAFAINVPVCLVSMLAGRRVLTESPRQASIARPDYLGAAMISLSLAGFALGVSQSEEWGWANPIVIASLVFAVVLVPLFVRRQRRHADPVLDLTLFEQRPFWVANLSTLCFGAGFAAVGLNNVLFLRQVWGWSVLHAGLATAIGPLVVAVLAPRTGKLATKIGFRPPLIAGPLVIAATMLTFNLTMDATPRLGLWLLLSVGVGVGVALVIPVNSSAAVSTLPPHRFAVGGAVNNTARQVGSVIGVAVLVAILGQPTTPAEIEASHHRGWWLVTVSVLLSAIVSTLQPSKVREPQVNATPAAAGNA